MQIILRILMVPDTVAGGIYEVVINTIWISTGKRRNTLIFSKATTYAVPCPRPNIMLRLLTPTEGSKSY